MTNHQELKRLARAVAAFTAKVSVSQYPSMQHQKIVAEQEFHAAASPDVVLEMIAEIDRLRCDVEVLQRLHDEDGIEHNKLRTQNQALVEALKDARTIMVLHRDLLDLKSSATWQLAIDPIDKLLTQAEGGV